MASAARRTTRRPRDPAATREAILEAACERLAQGGPDGVSLSDVAALAGVNRGTAYQHFETREALVRAATERVSEKLYRAVFGEPRAVGERAVEAVSIPDLTDRMAAFAMANPQLCRVWLLTVLASPEPARDPFWREYLDNITRFAATPLAQPDADPEVMTVLFMAGTFLWPVWAQAHDSAGQGPARLARRFSDECLRLSMYGSLRREHYPDIAERLDRRDIAGRISPASQEGGVDLAPRRSPQPAGENASTRGETGHVFGTSDHQD